MLHSRENSAHALCTSKVEPTSSKAKERRHSNGNEFIHPIALSIEKNCLESSKEVNVEVSHEATAESDNVMSRELLKTNAFSLRAEEFEEKYRLKHATHNVNVLHNNFMCDSAVNKEYDKCAWREHATVKKESTDTGNSERSIGEKCKEKTHKNLLLSGITSSSSNSKYENNNSNNNNNRVSKKYVRKNKNLHVRTNARRCKMAAEDDEGDVEYKWRLTNITPERFEHLVTQMQFRVGEGKGQCLYELGVCDDGTLQGLPLNELVESIHTIKRMANRLNFDVHVLEQCRVDHDVICDEEISKSDVWCAEVMVSRRHAGEREVSVAFCGDNNSGKSTLMGVLLNATLDNGTGQVRQSLFNHKHEVNSGKTSSLATRVWSVSLDELAEKLHDLSSTSSRSPLCNSIQTTPLLNAALCVSNVHLTHTYISVDNNNNNDDNKGSSQQPFQCEKSEAEEDKVYASDVEPELMLPMSTLAIDKMEKLHYSGNIAHNNNHNAKNAWDMKTTLESGIVNTEEINSCNRPREHHEGFQNENQRYLESTAVQNIRLITLIDLGGDITKTMLLGLMSREPHYMCICISATARAESVLPYLRLCRELRQLVMIVVTMIDRVEDFELDSFLLELADVLSRTGCSSGLVDSGDDLLLCIERFDAARSQMHHYRVQVEKLLWLESESNIDANMQTKKKEQSRLLYWHSVPVQEHVPIFCVSSVAGGHGLKQFRLCLSLLSASSRNSFATTVEPVANTHLQECNNGVVTSNSKNRKVQSCKLMESVQPTPELTSTLCTEKSKPFLPAEELVPDKKAVRPDRSKVNKDSNKIITNVSNANVNISNNNTNVNVKGSVSLGFEVLLDYSFTVAKVGNVVSGRVIHGCVTVGTHCYIGPDRTGKFHRVAIKGIHVDGAHVNEALPDDEACFALNELPPAVDLTHKGIVLSFRRPAVRWHFIAVIKVLSQGIKEQLQPICYSRNVRQAVEIHSVQDVADISMPYTLRKLIDQYHQDSIPKNNGDHDSGKNLIEQSNNTNNSKANKLIRIRCTFMFRPEVIRRKAPVVFQWTPCGLAVGLITATCTRRKRAWRERNL